MLGQQLQVRCAAGRRRSAVAGQLSPGTLQVLVGNKCDMDESKRAVPFSKGQALADELGIPFFETSAKNNINVTEVRLDSQLAWSSSSRHLHSQALPQYLSDVLVLPAVRTILEHAIRCPSRCVWLKFPAFQAGKRG